MERYEVGLIGAGIGTSLSPALHEREAAELGLDYGYRLIEIDEHEIGELLDRARDAGFRGVNVTHPCKQDVVAHLDALSDDAPALQAVNTVVFEDGRTTGHNTDTTGFAENFARGLPAPRWTTSSCSAAAARAPRSRLPCCGSAPGG